jgi:cellulose synthase/poly-beta-1,6-N-acetylglucosamine synthase-like glycosyltransferase
VVVAAYNEENVIAKTIRSILQSDYPHLEVVVVDDGSKDKTATVVKETFGHDPRVRLIRQPNGGKSSAICRGFKEAKGEFVVALDADTMIDKDAIAMLVRHFQDDRVAAVSGNVKVGNVHNLLTTWQHIEYVTGFNLERRAYAALNCVTVVPGAIGAWRKKAVLDAGLFKDDTLAEDTDMTLTLLRQGYRVEYEDRAIAYTESPEDLRSLLKQRYRWTYGTLQCLWKHRGALFRWKHGALGFVALPSMWLFQYVFQPLSAIADVLFIMGLFGNEPAKIIGYYFAFLAVDLFASWWAFHAENESPRPLLWLFLQRVVYRQYMTYVVCKSLFSALKGVAVGWNKLRRKGSVDEIEVQSRAG